MRRDINADQAYFNAGTTVTEALEVVMRIYTAEGYRERTMSDYRKFWAQFVEVVGKEYIDEYTTDDLRKYIVKLLDKDGLSAVTVNIRLSAVRAIFNRLEAESIITDNPVKRIRKLKTDQQKVFTLTDAQLKRLFSVIDRDSFAGFRDYVAFMVGLKCGLRANELRALEVADIDFDNEVIMLPGAKNKNRKNRAVPLSRKVKDDLMQLVAETREYFGPGCPYVFTNQFGEQMKDDHLRKRIDKYARQAGLKGECRASLHSLRHTMAVTFLNNGGNIRVLQKILGHADLSTTSVYLDYTDDQVNEQFRKIDENDNLDL
jgi:integrase/recombinase XerD